MVARNTSLISSNNSDVSNLFVSNNNAKVKNNSSYIGSGLMIDESLPKDKPYQFPDVLEIQPEYDDSAYKNIKIVAYHLRP